MSGKGIIFILFSSFVFVYTVQADSKNCTVRETVTKLDTVMVNTTGGEIIGNVLNITFQTEEGLKSSLVNTFYGVPYAEPPIGQLRFKKPLPRKPWSGKRYALEQAKTCFQYVVREYYVKKTDLSEDCLYLNVFVPNPAPKNASVMVYFHGGSFSEGYIRALPFSRFAATQQVIFVTVSYRLSSLGFMYFDSDECPGNMGLWDQQLALKWLNDNARRFGGDPGSITIWGQSAGGGSVGHHLLNTRHQNLFRRAILEGGSPFSYWAAENKSSALDRSYKVAVKVGCNQTTLESQMNCLRNVDPANLMNVSIHMGTYLGLNHMPVFDNQIVFENRRHTISGLSRKEVLMGTNRDDGAIMARNLMRLGKIRPDEVFRKSMEHFLNITDESLVKQARLLYKNDSIKEFAEEIATSRSMTDNTFLCATNELADILTEAGFPVFVYRYNHGPLCEERPKWIKADHGTMIPFELGIVAPSELELSARIMNYLGCFAKTGDPNYERSCNHERVPGPEGEQGQTRDVEIQTWPVYTKRTKGRIEIDFDSSLSAFGELSEEQCVFWRKILPTL